MTTGTGPAGPRLLLDRCAGTCPTWALGPHGSTPTGSVRTGRRVSPGAEQRNKAGHYMLLPAQAAGEEGGVCQSEGFIKQGVRGWRSVSGGIQPIEHRKCNATGCGVLGAMQQREGVVQLWRLSVRPGSECRAPGWVAGKTRQG